jgi:hypothetical protein
LFIGFYKVEVVSRLWLQLIFSIRAERGIVVPGTQPPHPAGKENRRLQLGSWESGGLKFYHIAAEYLYGLGVGTGFCPA